MLSLPLFFYILGPVVLGLGGGGVGGYEKPFDLQFRPMVFRLAACGIVVVGGL